MLTPGTIAALIIVPLGAIIAIASLAFIIAGFRHEPENSWDDFGFAAKAFGGVGLAIAALMIGLPLIGLALVGFNGDYMAYKPVSGQVEQVASRQIASGKAMETRYVFQINGQPYGVDDTRAALVKTGDTVNLNCVKEFVWGSTNNGYACNWG